MPELAPERDNEQTSKLIPGGLITRNEGNFAAELSHACYRGRGHSEGVLRRRRRQLQEMRDKMVTQPF